MHRLQRTSSARFLPYDSAHQCESEGPWVDWHFGHSVRRSDRPASGSGSRPKPRAPERLDSHRRNRMSATTATTAQCQTDFFRGSMPVRLRLKTCPMAPFHGPCGANAARSIPTGSLANAERWFDEPDRGAESTLGSGADRNRTSATTATTAQCQTDFFRGSTPVRLRSKACLLALFCGPCGANAARSIPTAGTERVQREMVEAQCQTDFFRV